MADDDSPALLRLVRVAVQVPGAVVGASLGALSGDPASSVLAALTGLVLSSAGTELANRVLSQSEERRVGTVLLKAAGQISARQVMGEEIRSDGFFEGDRSSGSEFVEGVLLAARDTFEERKNLYLGNLIANVAFSESIDARTANLALRIAADLSWTDICVLSLFVQPDRYPMPARPVGRGDGWDSWAVSSSYKALISGGTTQSLLFYPRVTGSKGEPRIDTNIAAVKLTSAGELITWGMDLAEMPATDAGAVHDLLLSESDNLLQANPGSAAAGLVHLPESLASD